MTVGETIQYYRKQHDLSQEQLGAMLYVSRQTVSQWEKDQTVPTVENLIRLHEIFGVSVDELLAVAQSNSAPQTQQPLERYTFTYTEQDIRRLNRFSFRRSYAILIASIVFLLTVILLELPNDENRLATGISIGSLLMMLWITAAAIIYSKRTCARNIRYHCPGKSCSTFALYDDHLEITDSRNDTAVFFQRLSFDDVDRYTNTGDFILIEHGKIANIVKTKEVPQNSRFFLLLQNKVMAQKVDYDIPKGVKALSTALCILTVICFVVIYSVIAVLGVDSGELYAYDWLLLPFAAVPLSCLAYGMRLKKKGYRYRKNLIFGGVFLWLHLLFFLLSLLPH